MKRNARETSFKSLINELIEVGVEIKNLKDAYRNEMKKVKKSIKNGALTTFIFLYH